MPDDQKVSIEQSFFAWCQIGVGRLGIMFYRESNIDMVSVVSMNGYIEPLKLVYQLTCLYSSKRQLVPWLLYLLSYFSVAMPKNLRTESSTGPGKNRY